eukprot:752606-Hanusia_phi.AAC.3
MAARAGVVRVSCTVTVTSKEEEREEGRRGENRGEEGLQERRRARNTGTSKLRGKQRSVVGRAEWM